MRKRMKERKKEEKKRTRGAAKAWPSDGKTHKHYINALRVLYRQ
jgi:hypothetical protein